MSKMPTLNAIRAEALRVHGPVLDVFDRHHPPAPRHELTVLVESHHGVCFFGRSKAAARRLALETLRMMASKEAP